VLAHADAHGRVRDSVGPIARLDAQQPLDLLERLHVLVPGEEREHVVVAHRVVIGLEQQCALEQQLRIVIHVQLHADLCQQSHALHVIAVPQQELADELLGGDDVAV
jgi:hypothetical protein